MKKLNKQKIKWIVREVTKREKGVWTIAQTQDITKQHSYIVAKRFKNHEPEFKKCGRKPIPINEQERMLVKQTYNEFQVGATMIEQILDEKGIHINHNRIRRIMLEEGLVKREPKKSRRRGWVRYEKKHSNSLWHADWFQHKGKDCLLIIDDTSRLIVHYKKYSDSKIDKLAMDF
jgi:putative transposase